jgi:hypothetical protein
MDRQGFIQQMYSDSKTAITSGACGADECVCNETGSSPNKQSVNRSYQRACKFLLLVLGAFVFAGLLTIVKIDIAKANMINSKTYSILACSPGIVAKNASLNENRQSNKNNKGNSCPHDWGAGTCICIAESKRKKNYSG